MRCAVSETEISGMQRAAITRMVGQICPYLITICWDVDRCTVGKKEHTDFGRVLNLGLFDSPDRHPAVQGGRIWILVTCSAAAGTICRTM